MRQLQIHNRWTLCVESLKQKWAGFVNGIVLALTEEEMKIRREELEKQITAGSQRD